jgi:hypothetical protein
MKLLSLVHVRSAYPPRKWALFDTREFHFAWHEHDQIQLLYNDKCVRMCGDEFGKLVNWDEKMSHSWAHVGFPRAFLALGVQRDILAFLCEIFLLIIGDSEPTGNTRG